MPARRVGIGNRVCGYARIVRPVPARDPQPDPRAARRMGDATHDARDRVIYVNSGDVSFAPGPVGVGLDKLRTATHLPYLAYSYTRYAIRELKTES